MLSDSDLDTLRYNITSRETDVACDPGRTPHDPRPYPRPAEPRGCRTVLALIAAIVILVTIVLPAEYAIDPTGIGRVLQLTEMGEIKQQLAREAEEDRRLDSMTPSPRSDAGSPVSILFARLLIAPAHAAGPARLAQVPERTDETVITLAPAEGREYKMRLPRGAQVRFSWTVEGGVVNYDLHGTPAAGGRESSYKSNRGVRSDEGVLTAGFDGTHGWFFRNRGSAPVTVRLRTTGPYEEIRRVM